MGAVGYGYWGPNVVRNLLESPDCDFRVLCDADPSRLEKFRARHAGVAVETRLDALLANHDLDAVYVATPVSTHFGIVSAALEAGKHVMVEKPLAASVEEGEALCRLARERGLVLMVGHTFVYSPPVIKVKSLLDAGTLGDLYYIDSVRVNLGLFQRDVSVIWDLAPHDISILLYWLGASPLSVAARGRSYVQDGLEDVAFLTLEFPGSVLAQLQVSWLAPSKQRRMTLVGNKSMVVYDDQEFKEKIKVFDTGVDKVRAPESFGEYQLVHRSGDVFSPRIDNTEPLWLECHEFLECVREGRRPKTDGEFGLSVLHVVQGAQTSLRNRGKPEEIA